jgi:hypothetical protein
MDKHEAPRTAPATLAIADRLDDLARHELGEVERFIESIPPLECAALLIEACRCVDHIHVVQKLSANEEGKLSVQDFDIIVRGWNVLFGLLMQRKGEFDGVPLRKSVPELRKAIIGIMHFAGRYVLLNRTAEMIRHGMVVAVAQGNEIDLTLGDRTLSDHFHDQVDHGKFAELNAKTLREFQPIDSDAETAQHLRNVMGKLTFPWKTPEGVMIGYGADPEVDNYFLDAVTQNTLQWRGDAGIHPLAELGGYCRPRADELSHQAHYVC